MVGSGDNHSRSIFQTLWMNRCHKSSSKVSYRSACIPFYDCFLSSTVPVSGQVHTDSRYKENKISGRPQKQDY
jgi:hypothetical protein